MTNRNDTFVTDHLDHEITIRSLDYPNGWVIEIVIKAENYTFPPFRDRDNCYKNIDEARSAGLQMAIAQIKTRTINN